MQVEEVWSSVAVVEVVVVAVVAAPAAMGSGVLAQWQLHHQPPGWLHSVALTSPSYAPPQLS